MQSSEAKKRKMKEWRERNKDHVLAYAKTYRKEHPEEHKEAKRICVERIKQHVLSLKSGGCTICGYNEDPHNIHFHHTNPSTKTKGIKNAVRYGWSKERIDEEVAKCIVVCASCHQKIHLGKI